MGAVQYYPGGFSATAPAQNMAERQDDATQTVTTYDTVGNVTSTTPYTAAQVAQMQAQQAAQAVQVALATAQGGIDALLAQQSALASQIATDAAMFAATPVGSTLTSEHIAALTRIVNGFGTTMQAITAHLILTNNAPATTPLSLTQQLENLI